VKGIAKALIAAALNLVVLLAVIFDSVAGFIAGMRQCQRDMNQEE